MRRTLIELTLLALSLGLVSAATLTGKVVGADGKPVTGANVFVYLTQQGERKTLDLLTDAAGSFTVEADPPAQSQNISLASVCAYAPGYALTNAEAEGEGQRHHPLPGREHQRHRR